ncbi:MAG: DNA polymerase III subunit gamma/tau [Chloroflexota bacterium]
MASQVFYRKWRPQTLAGVVGQEAVTKTLLNALSGNRISHAYLFCGPRGTGKTSTGRILAKAVNCLTNGKGEPCNTCAMCQAITEGRALDVIEIDAASNTGVDDIRNLREKVNYVPNQARYKVYIIDEVHMLSNSASNALLKTLEEPPPHVIFVLATTEFHKILPTILSRCQHFDFRRLSQTDIVAKLTHICQSENIKIEPEALRLLAKSSTGSLRDAENLLEQLTTYYGSEIGLKQVQAVLGITGDWRAKELLKHVVNGDVPAGIKTINNVNNDGLDLKQFNRELVAYLRELLLIKTGSSESIDLTAENVAELKELATKASLPQILKAVKLFGQLEFGFDGYSTLPLELAIVDCRTIEEPQASQPKEVAAPPQVSRPKPKSEPAVAKPAATAATPSKPKPAETPVLSAVTAAPPPPQPPQSKPEPVKEPAPAVATNKPQAGNEVEHLRINWKQVVEQAPADTKKSSALALFRSAGVKPVSSEGNTIVLAFRHKMHKEQIEKLENQRIAEKIISNFLGHPCRIRCILEEDRLLNAAQKMGAEIISVEEK